MTVDAKRRKGETFESLFRRFSRRVQLSGTVTQAKRDRFLKERPNKTLKKKQALRRVKIAKTLHHLKRTGQIEDGQERDAIKKMRLK